MELIFSALRGTIRASTNISNSYVWGIVLMQMFNCGGFNETSQASIMAKAIRTTYRIITTILNDWEGSYGFAIDISRNG
jgi:hypothetical protein